MTESILSQESIRRHPRPTIPPHPHTHTLTHTTYAHARARSLDGPGGNQDDEAVCIFDKKASHFVQPEEPLPIKPMYRVIEGKRSGAKRRQVVRDELGQGYGFVASPTWGMTSSSVRMVPVVGSQQRMLAILASKAPSGASGDASTAAMLDDRRRELELQSMAAQQSARAEAVAKAGKARAEKAQQAEVLLAKERVEAEKRKAESQALEAKAEEERAAQEAAARVQEKLKAEQQLKELQRQQAKAAEERRRMIEEAERQRREAALAAEERRRAAEREEAERRRREEERRKQLEEEERKRKLKAARAARWTSVSRRLVLARTLKTVEMEASRVAASRVTRGRDPQGVPHTNHPPLPLPPRPRSPSPFHTTLPSQAHDLRMRRKVVWRIWASALERRREARALAAAQLAASRAALAEIDVGAQTRPLEVRWSARQGSPGAAAAVPALGYQSSAAAASLVPTPATSVPYRSPLSAAAATAHAPPPALPEPPVPLSLAAVVGNQLCGATYRRWVELTRGAGRPGRTSTLQRPPTTFWCVIG